MFITQSLNAWPVGLRAVGITISFIWECLLHERWGMVYSRYEKGKEGIGRAFFCTVVARRVIVLHAYIKKSEKTPRKELEIARKRQKEVKRENTSRND